MQRRTATPPPTSSRPKPWGWYLLLLVPFIAILWVPSYAGATPALAGIPFFYWYQFLWVFISAVLTAIVYFATREPEPPTTGEVINEELA
jgi:membrane protein implicated in regulation of membrane protease activity